ncbi:hypothetical protein J11TS1_07620 [Oceanobacillus sp. J11TS1]|nr:hypothetical protein J11TS1_07620 [Oceanobacillus sp. J11TS1]
MNRLTEDLRILLTNFKTVDKENGEEVEGILFEIHRIITTFEWHFSEISDLNIKILKGLK